MSKSINQLEGYYIDEELDRCVHITWVDEETIALDVFASAKNPEAECIYSVLVNLKKGAK